MRHAAVRLAHGILVLLALSVLTFLFAELAPGDPFAEMRFNPRISPGAVEALRARYGLDDPLPVRYLRWLRSVASGEMGWSFLYDAPAGPLLWVRSRNTLLLAVPATLVAWLLALRPEISRPS